MCPPCRALSDRWADSRPSQIFVATPVLIAGAAYNFTAAGMRDTQHARYERWRLLVREQMRGVRAACAAGNHAPARDDLDEE